MKAVQSFIFTVIICLMLPSSALFAAINKDKIVGTWQVSAIMSADVPYKNWQGSITITRSGNVLSGVLDWSCSDENWHVREELAVTVKGNEITLQGTTLELLAHPENNSEYHLDSFKFSMDDVTEQTVPVSFVDGQGSSATFTITKG